MDFNNEFKTVNFGGGFSPKNKKNIKSLVVAAIVVVFLAALVSTCYYTVNDKQQAVLTTFGKYTATTESGIHFKAPFGIQKSTLVDVNVYRKIEIGYSTTADNTTMTIPYESKMITGDLNIVNVDFFVEYKISDPVKYLYSSGKPEDVLKNISQSQIRDIVSSYNVDDVLTSKRGEIQTKIKNLIILELDKYDIGLVLTDIKIQDAEPPTQEVIAAFKAVETAKQDKQTSINEAKAYENANLPKAYAQEDQLITNAEFLKQNRINDAKKQTSMFEAIYSQYRLNPTITKQRMYYEMIEQVLPGVTVYIDTQSEANTSKLIPLGDFVSSEAPQE